MCGARRFPVPRPGDGGDPRRRGLEPALRGGGSSLPAVGPSRRGRSPLDRVAQPAIIAASLAALHVLGELGIEAETAVGHSLGEIAALSWAGALDADSLLRIAAARGRAMAHLPDETGAMASLEAGAVDVQSVLNGDLVVIAGFNAPRQTVISGPAAAVESVMDRVRRRGWAATRLAVSHAFHSPLVAAAVPALAAAMARESIGRPRRKVVSSVTGGATT